MSVLTPSDMLAHYSRRLRVGAPKDWEAFVECFDAYATDVTLAVTRAETADILVAQGRAKAFLHLLDIFKNCQTYKTPVPSNHQTPPTV